MGWTVLYLAFGLVALWLLGEVLLQYKARLRWRLLAFFGFLGVVLGVVLPSVLVIAVGAGAFAVGQTLVTMSFRRGFSTGWALGGKPGTSRRRREIRPMAPLEEGGEDEYAYAGPEPHPGAEGPDGPDAPGGHAPDGYRREEYARDGYGEDGYGRDGYGEDGYARDGYARDGYGRDEYGPDYGHEYAGERGGYRREESVREEYPAPGYPSEGYPAPPASAPAAAGQDRPDIYAAYAQTPDYATTTGYGEYRGYAPQGADPYAGGYPADGGTGGYPAYAEPYPGGYRDHGPAGDPLGPPPPAPAPGGYGYDDGAVGQWPASGPSYYPETPPGGVWMPQQRDAVPAEGYGYPPPQSYAAQAEPQGYYDGRGY